MFEIDSKKLCLSEAKSSEYAPIFQYLYNSGFRIGGEKARALFICYILKRQYCKDMDTFWILYEAVYEVVRYAESIQLWNPNYNMYDGLKERLLNELEQIDFWI